LCKVDKHGCGFKIYYNKWPATCIGICCRHHITCLTKICRKLPSSENSYNKPLRWLPMDMMSFCHAYASKEHRTFEMGYVWPLVSSFQLNCIQMSKIWEWKSRSSSSCSLLLCIIPSFDTVKSSPLQELETSIFLVSWRSLLSEWDC
jgi:hypothetical protein